MGRYQVWQDVRVVDVHGEDDLTVVRFADNDGDALLVRFRFDAEQEMLHLPQLMIWSALETTVTVVRRDDEVAIVDDAALLADAAS